MHTIITPQFTNISCSQCGHDFGPGNHGYSHCSDHRQPVHTPGPWTVLEDDSGQINDDCLGPWVISDGQNDLANVYSRENATVPAVSREVSICNAYLMAAAPDLLEALKLVQGFAWGMDGSKHAKETKRQIAAAIAKAMGNAS